MNLNAYGVEAMPKQEMKEISGGEVMEYAELTWSGTDNEIVYAVEAVANGVKMLYNGVAACVNEVASWFDK